MRGRGWIVTAAIMVAGIRMWMQVRGKAKTPFSEFAVGWSVLFFFLALVTEASPGAGAPLAMLVVVSDFLINGQSLFEDLSSLTTSAETTPILTPQPFAAGSQPLASATRGTGQAGHLTVG